MDNCLRHGHRTLVLPSAVFSPKPHLIHNISSVPSFRFLNKSQKKPQNGGFFTNRYRPMKIKTGFEASYHESSALNSPRETSSPEGTFLSSLLQKSPRLFLSAVVEQLELLVDSRNAAVARMTHSSGSDEALLHRKIAQLKERECQTAVVDIMYLLIFDKFSRIEVRMVPKLSSCIFNSRLEILPFNDWVLESIYNYNMDVVDMIKEQLAAIICFKTNCSLTDSREMIEVRRFVIARIYIAALLYGYVLKSVLLRYSLEQRLYTTNNDHETVRSFKDISHHTFKEEIFSPISDIQSEVQGLIRPEKTKDIICYINSFDTRALEKCTRLRSKEAAKLVEHYSCLLFWDEKSGVIENNDVILTTYSSLQRLVKEAVAFGSFLWETENYIDKIYKLRGN